MAEAGTKMNKLNVFNDFIGAAEYLIDEGWTSPDYLTIEGGSNGGLLVGATSQPASRPLQSRYPRVGVMDMMRYHLFTIGWNWASDYGTSADSPEMAKYLFEYSPIHNIKNDGTPYPAILVTTADHDDRVVPRIPSSMPPHFRHPTPATRPNSSVSTPRPATVRANQSRKCLRNTPTCTHSCSKTSA